jgi:carbon storage regulator
MGIRELDAKCARRQRIMLILTRRPMQTVTIGNEVTVTVLKISGNRVRIGVNAPRDTTVLRMESIKKARPRRAADVDH